MKWLRTVGAWIAFAALILLGWQLLANHTELVRLFLSSPVDLVRYARENSLSLLNAGVMTGLEALAGLSLALLFATSAMILISINPGLLRFILPPMILSQVIPLITIAPLLIVIIGIGVQSKIIMAAIISFFPIFINLAVSVRDIPTGFQEMTTLYRPNWLFKVRHLYLPLSLPSLMASLRVAATLSVIGAIVAEFTGAEIGLGKNLFLAMRRLEPELMMSSIILSALLGSGLYLAIVLVERSVGRWYLR